MKTKVAVVTGGNKGIGYEIVKGLCKKFDGTVYLTARNEQLGKEAVSKLNELGFQPKFHQLDIINQESIDRFRDYLKNNEDRIDILVNNAAIAYWFNSTEPIGVQAEVTTTTNYFGTLRVCESLFPLLRSNAQVVNVSSSVGHLSHIPSSELKSKFSDPNLTVNDLNQLMEQYVRDAKNNVHIENGWAKYSYVVSKVGLSALTFIQQREFDNKEKNKNISVNAVHPGYIATDMTRHTGPLTVEEGALAPLFLALGGHGLKGQYVWRDCTVVDWCASSTPTSH